MTGRTVVVTTNESYLDYPIYFISGGVVFASTTYPTANLAIYIPFVIDEPLTVQRLFWANGTVASGNVDIGVYSVDGTRLVSSGSTAQSGPNAHQSVDVTDTLLGRGVYYIGVSMDNTTGTLFRRNAAANDNKIVGCAQEASAFPLPATATFATITTGFFPLVGVLFRSEAP